MMGKMEIRSPPGSRPRDGRHCDLCGCSQPAVRCDKCGCQIFCLSCDDMYHRHPKRRFHLRKAVDPMPATSQARPILPMKASHLNATNPGDPSKMPLPPPRKKKSLFSSFRKPSSENNSPPLPKKEYSWTDRLGSIKKFMSNRPLPPLPLSDDNDTDSQPATNGQAQRGDLSFIHKRTEERPPQLPQRSPRSPDFPGMNQEKENRIPSTPPHLPGQIRNGSLETNANHMNHNHQFNSNDPNHWNNQINHQNDGQGFGTLNRQRPFMPPGAPGYPGGMHQSSSATDLHSLHNPEAMRGQVPPHYPHYPVNPHMPPHYPYPMYPGYPNYPQYFGNSFANLSNPPTSEGDFSDSEASSKHSSKRHAFRKRAKRSQSVVMDRMAYPGQFFPFAGYPGYPWGAPMPMEAPPSPASSVRSLNRSGRARRRKKGTSEEDDEELSETSSPMSRPKSSSSDPKEHPRAPLATQTTSSEYESDDDADKRRNKINTIRRPPEPVKSPSPAVNRKVAKLKKSSSKQSDSDTPESPAARNDRRPSDSTTDQRQPVRQSPVQQQPVRHSPVQQQPNLQRSPTPQQLVMRESPAAQSTSVQPQTSNSASSENWECRHCTFVNPIGNRICQVCCKTATPRTETPVSNQSRPASSSAKHRKESVGSENEYFVPDETNENEASKKDKQDMASLNSALDEAEKQISRGLEELMKLKDDIDSNSSKEKTRSPETQSKMDSEDKPVYKSSGRMRTSILDKLNLNKSQTVNSSVSTSTETQTDQNNRTIDKIITARRLSNSSSASEAYNSPTAQSPELERGYLGNKQKRDSSCQTQQDTISDYLEKRKVAEESFLGRPINNFGFSYGDRMDMVTSPVPSMYDRFYGGGYGMMQRSHSRASLFTGRMNDFGTMDYGPGPGFGYGPTPMYRSVSRGSLTGDYPQNTISDYLEKRKVAEESFLGRPINNFGFSYGDRMDMVTSPIPPMYDRFYGGGYGMMQRSHSRASLFTGRMNDFGPMDYGPGPGFGYGPTPMYRSVSRGSLTGDYPKRKVAEESFLGRPINNFGFSYGDRMDMVTSPIPPMYDRFYGGGYGMMQRSHSRASLFTGRMNDFGPMDYGPGPGFGYGPTPMYRSVSRGSLTGDYPKRKVAEESFLGRPINNFGFSYGDRMDMVTSPIPQMYDRFYGGGYGMMQRSHSRASLFTGKMNDFGPMDYGPGPGFGYGPTPMYRSVSRGSLTGDYPDGRVSGFQNSRKPDYYLSMEELVERRCQDNINNIRAQGLELVRMIREAEQQGFNADDIQVALTHCGKQNPLEWLQENWRNMVDSVVTLSTNYGNDKKENDIGLLSENEARDALRLHKGNIWAAVTECVEGRQRKYLELSARGNFSRQDIVDALTAGDGDVEMAYAKLTKSTGKPFLMRIWGQGEGAQNQDGAQPMPEQFRDGPRRFLKDDTLNNDDLSDDLWSEDDGPVEWDDEEDYEEERGDIEDLRTCQEDLPSNTQDVTTPESEISDYCDAFSVDDRNASSPSDDVFFVIPPEAKPEKKKGFLSKLVALRRDSKERAETSGKEEVSSQQDNKPNEDSISERTTNSSEQKNGGALNTLKNKFSAIKDSVTGGTKNDKKAPTAQLDRRTIIVRGQLEHESLSTKEDTKAAPINNSSAENTSKIPNSDAQNKKEIKPSEEVPIKEAIKLTKIDTKKTPPPILNENDQIKTDKDGENESKQIDSKKAENKNSHSLAERLKFAKQTRNSFDAPGPSGINKESLVQPTVTKMDTPTQSKNEISLQKDLNLNSNNILEKEVTTDKTNFDKIPSVQNLNKYESTEKSISANQNNHQVAENIANIKIVESNDIKNSEVLQTARQNQPKEFNGVTAAKSTKIDTLTSKSLNSNILEAKKESSPKPQVEHGSDKQSTIKSETKIDSENAIKSKSPTAKNMENKASPLLVSKKGDNHTRISEASKQNNISKADTSTTIANLSGKNIPTELKITNSQKEKPKNTVTHAKEFSPEISNSENKTSLVKERDGKNLNNQEGDNTKSKNEKAKLNKDDNKTVQQTENKIGNIETSSETANLSKSNENSKNLQSAENPTAIEKSQKSLQENIKSEVIVSAKKENLLTGSNESATKNVDSAQNTPTESSVANDFQTTMSDKIPKTDETLKTATSDDIPKTESDIPSDHNIHKVDLIKPEESATDAGAIKYLKETNLIEFFKHDIQSNLERSEALSDNKLAAHVNKTLPDLSATSSSAIIENPPTQAILEKSSDQLELPKVKSASSEASSKHLISNQTNAVQTLDIVNKENSSANIEHVENLPQTSKQGIDASQRKDIDTSSAQNLETISDNFQSVTEINKDSKVDTSMISSENNKELVVNTEAEKAESSEKIKGESITATTDEVAENLLPSNSSLTNLEPVGNISKSSDDKSLVNKVVMLNKDINEHHAKEIPMNKNVLNEKEIADVTNSINKSPESELKNSEIKVVLEGESEVIPANTALEKALHASPEIIQNTFASTENQNKLTSVATPSTSKDTSVPSNDHEKIEQSKIQIASESDPTKNANLSSSEIINNDVSNDMKLLEPVLSKEFPDKNIVEVPVLSDNIEKTTTRVISESVNSESLSTALSTILDNSKISEISPSTNTSDSDKSPKALLSTSNLENTSTSSESVMNNSETTVELGNVLADSNTASSATTAEISFTEDNSLSVNATESSKTEQNSSNTNIDNSSVLEKIAAIAKAANDSINEISATNTASSSVITSDSSIANSSDSTKIIPSASSTTDSNTKEISVSKLSTLSSDTKSLSNDAKSSALKLTEQHSKAPENIAANSSVQSTVKNSSSTPAVPSVQRKVFQRTPSEELNESSASESEDTDIEFSDNSRDSSRRGSLMLPSPVDALRSRFEGLASGATIRGGPIRPASPFRRMSFNSRKQVIALERKKDTSTDKPWYHKIDPEPARIVQPKRSVKQQLEMERKVRKMVADRKCRTYKKAEIVVQLMEMNFEEEEAIQAANECSTLEQAISYLQQECSLCAGHFSVSQIISMTHCEHRACRECIRAYFTVQIRDRTILDLLCPFCNEPDIGDEDVAQDYFNHLDIMLKKLVDTEIHELFQRKLRDRVLMKDPNFRWCSQCSSGFIAMPNLKRLICPDCNAVTCASCRRLWEKEHQGISCEAFAAMKDATDPEAQAAGLAKMLTEDGISCPSCHFRYALAKGGCMHFRCIQCQHDFCSGCSRPFKMGQKCGVSEFCAKLGLHAHHPRNCLFYLRDKEPEDLQKLLDMNDVKYNREPPEGMEIKSTCQVMEQKETADGMMDDYCGKDVQDGYAGLCRVHYVEYLGQLVNKHKVDPIQIFDNDDLELVLKRANIRLPPKRYRENDAQYREKLIKVIQEELPLDRMDGS